MKSSRAGLGILESPVMQVNVAHETARESMPVVMQAGLNR